MEDLLSYLLKTGTSTIILVAAYLAFFRKENLFWFNRLYLLSAAILPWIIPLVTLTITRTLEVPAASAIIHTIPEGEVMSPGMTGSVAGRQGLLPAISTDLVSFLFAVYMAGLLFFLFRLGMSFVKVNLIIRRCTRKSLGSDTIYVTEEEHEPFSFFGKHVISRHMLSHTDLSLILRHERVHAAQCHSFDIVATEIVKALQWFNPFAWMLVSQVKINLEYMADAVIAEAGGDVEKYQYMLINLANGSMSVPLVSRFSQTHLKKRLIMMKKQVHPKKLTGRCLVALPLAAGLFLTFCSKETVYDIASSDNVVTGYVTNDRSHEPVEGVLVSVKGQDVQVLTNEYGAYSIRLSGPDDTLKFGQNVYAIPAGRSQVNVSLSPGMTSRPVERQMTRSPWDGMKWYVDGQPVPGGPDEVMLPDIASMKAITTESAIRNDGSRVEGVFLFYLTFTRNHDYGSLSEDKAPNEEMPVASQESLQDIAVRSSADMTGFSDTIVINGNDKGQYTPLYIVDGDRIKEGETLKMLPKTIKSVQSFQGDQAYNVIPTEDAWLRGVVKIETK